MSSLFFYFIFYSSNESNDIFSSSSSELSAIGASSGVISSISSSQATGESALQTTMPAGMTLFMRVQSITLTSGLAIGYNKYTVG